MTWRRYEPNGGVDSRGLTHLNMRQDCLEKMGFTGGSCFVTTPWSRKDAPEDGTGRQQKLNRANKKKSKSGRKTCVWKNALALPRNCTTRFCRVSTPPR